MLGDVVGQGPLRPCGYGRNSPGKALRGAGVTSEPRDAADVRVFPPAIPLVIILLGIGLNYRFPLASGYVPAGRGRYWAGALLMAVAIFGLGWGAVRLVRGSGQSENPWKPTTEIIQQWPVSYPPATRCTCRCCWYVWGSRSCCGISGSSCSLPLCAWLLQRLVIAPEEAYLERKFGETYLAYKRRVRRWIQTD